MYLLDFLKVVFATFIALFPIVNPIGDAPIFLSMTRGYPPSVQKVLARKVATYGFILLAISLLFGSQILDFFGVSLVVVQIAGGLVVASTGGTSSPSQMTTHRTTRESPGHWRAQSITPSSPSRSH